MATISGNVIFDRDRSATISAGDSGIANVPVVLQDVITTARLTVLTDANGNYTFLNVPNGNYRIVESYGTFGGVPTPGNFLTAATGAIPQGINPPITAVTNPPPGATNLDSVTPDTLLVTVSGADLTGQNFLNGPVIYTPVQTILDSCAVISGDNLINAADDGTFGMFPQGTPANTGVPTEPYPGVTPDFTYVLPNPNVYAPMGGEYTVQNIMNNSMSANIGAWWRIADHTMGNETGRMMIVNGYNPGAVFFRDTVTVQPNTNYLFTSWILNLFKVGGYPDPQLGVRILDQNGGVLYSATLGALIPVNEDAPEWKQIGSVINSQNNTSLTVEFLSEGPEVIGNDYAIDDISFNEIQVPEFIPVKTVDRESANVGETVQFTVTLENTCTSPLTDVFFQDIVPGGLTFVPGTVIVNSTAISGADPNIGFTLPDVPGGGSVTVTFTAEVTSVPNPNPALNSATISYSYTPVEGGIPGEFNVTSNEVPVQVGTQADVSVVKTANPAPGVPGGMLTYTIVVENAGPSAAENVVLTDTIPANLLNVEFSTDGGVTFSPWISPLALGTFAAGSSRTILIRGILSPTAAGEIVNTASVTSTTPDPDLDNNTSTVVTPIQLSADISVVKTASPSPILAGEVITYTLLVSNAGPETAVNTNLADTLPTELDDAESSIDGGSTWQPFNGTLFLGDLLPNESRQILIRATVSPTAVGNLTNTATVDSETPDSNPDNNTSTVVTPVRPIVPVQTADISITKISAPNPVQRGGTLTYTLTVSNAGPDEAVNVILRDDIPASLTNAEFSLDGGATWQLWTGAYNLGTLAAGGSVIVLIRATVAAAAIGSIVNTAVVSSQTSDPNPDNNTDTNRTEIESLADLSVTKRAQPNQAVPGELLTYTIVVTNNGPDSAQDVLIYDEAPPELTGVQFSIDGGLTWNTWSNPYLLGSLNAGQSRVLLIRATVVSSVCGIISNTVVAVSDTPDPNPDNNTATVDTPAQGRGGEEADLSIQKTACPNQVMRCQRLTYTLTVSNAGPDIAEEVVITDVLPADICRPVFSNDEGQSWQAWSGIYHAGSLAPGESISIFISGCVSTYARCCIRNTASVSSLTEDTNPSNNTDSASVSVCRCCSNMI
jgi:uncharacterized repeat protein (TIGR01451 family)